MFISKHAVIMGEEVATENIELWYQMNDRITAARRQVSQMTMLTNTVRLIVTSSLCLK